MIRINQIKLKPELTNKDSVLDAELKKKISRTLKLDKSAGFEYEIVKKSIDSRKKPDIFIVFSVNVSINDITDSQELRLINKLNVKNIMLIKPVLYEHPSPLRPKDKLRPVIAGFGPAGMFCGLFLARAGFKPIIIERGEAVDDRIESVNALWKDKKLNSESNAQFGEGGAGTFSDGKLNTQVKEVYGRISLVLKTLVEHGADSSILYEAKPHVGTDKLVHIVKSIRNEIINLGGEVRFNTKLSDIHTENNQVKEITITNVKSGEESCILCDTLVLSIGHSARDTFSMLKGKLNMESKPFAVGLRIEHDQELININEFGDGKYKDYMAASYKLTYTASSGRGVYSFCMCPGGYVVNASSEPGMLAVNGMSYSDRASGNANSALIVTVDSNDYGSDDALAGMYFQRNLEKAFYDLESGNIPIQRYEDFKNNIRTTDISMNKNSISPKIKGWYSPSNLNEALPKFIGESLVEAIDYFGKKIPGFDSGDAILSGIESRTSSPVRILRGDNMMSNISGIYPCGEGAGYAGGITSAAVDGVKVYEKIVSTKV